MQLTLISNEQALLKPSCTVKIDNEVHKFDDFVMVGASKEGRIDLLQNTDAITLGMAAQLMFKAFQDAYVELNAEQRIAVDKFFHGEESINDIHSRRT